VADTGPWAIVRHPMYTASMLMFPGMALALGCSGALIPVWVVCAMLVLRTHWEDQTRQAALSGYQDYTNRVPYKLLPSVW
jgi:protein-S-isoprenylcysteine O-methyltransferase Ste14